VVRVRTVFLASFALLWTLSARVGPSLDGGAMHDVARNLAVHGQLHADREIPGYTVPGADGRPQIKYPLAWSLLEVPGVAIGRLVETAGLPLADGDLLGRLVRGLTPAAVGAAGIALLLLALLRAGAAPRAALVASLAFHLATVALPYLRSHYSEVVQVAATDLGLFAVASLAARPSAMAAVGTGLAAGLLLLIKPALFPVTLGLAAGGAFAVRAASGRGRLIALAGAGGAVAVAAMVVENLVRFGTPFLGDYGYFPIPQRIEWPQAGRAFGLLLGSGIGLLWYAPVAVLAIAGARRAVRHPLGVAAAVSAGGLVLLYSAYTGWHGAEQWGPRYLVPIVGPLAVLAAPALESASRLRKTVVAGLVAAGLWVNVPGALVHYLDFYAVLPYRPYWHEPLDEKGHVTVPVARDNLYLPHFVPAFSPIRGHRWLLGHALSGDPDLAADCPWREQVVDRPAIRSADVAPRVDLWFVPEPGWPDSTRAQAWVLLGVLALATAAAWVDMMVLYRRPPGPSHRGRAAGGGNARGPRAGGGSPLAGGRS